RLGEAGTHVLGLRRQAREGVAPRLAAHADLVGHDVAGTATRDHADVGGGLGVQAAEPHRGDGLGRDADRAYALLGRHAGMGGTAADHDLDQVRARRAREGEAHGVAVEHEAATGADPAEVEVAGAEEPHLLADREHDVERRVAEAALAAHADALADDRHARLVVAAEHGRAVAPDHVVLDDGAHAGAGLDRVLIAGAGAVGSVVGGLLAAAGSAVTLLGRRAHVDAVRARGLALDGLFGVHRVTGVQCATAATGLDDPFGAIFLTVKTYDAD